VTVCWITSRTFPFTPLRNFSVGPEPPIEQKSSFREYLGKYLPLHDCC
jgi:hypothetical protein